MPERQAKTSSNVAASVEEFGWSIFASLDENGDGRLTVPSCLACSWSRRRTCTDDDIEKYSKVDVDARGEIDGTVASGGRSVTWMKMSRREGPLQTEARWLQYVRCDNSRKARQH